jgi:Predicted nucleic acid-binding protein, contains PIN domain
VSALAGLLDTSVIIGLEMLRPLNASALPERQYLSVISLAELQAGVHSAPDAQTRARRMHTVDTYSRLTVLEADETAAGHWALLRSRLRETGQRVNVNDLWIAAIALAHELPIVTQDADFDALIDLGGPSVIRI